MYRIPFCGARFDEDAWRGQIGRWSRLLDDYAYDNDVPFWYGEQPMNASFAMAASLNQQAGGWSLVEPGAKGKDGKKRRYIDAWFGLSHAKVQWYTMEAKFAYCGRAPEIKAVRTLLGRSRKQLNDLDRVHRCGRRLSVVWLVPRAGKATGEEAASKLLHQRARSLAVEIGRRTQDARFHYVASVTVGNPAEYSGSIYPGVILVAREWVRTT